jgi:hypothetical protein
MAGYLMKQCPFCGAAGKHLMFLFDGTTSDGASAGHVYCQPCGGRGPRGAPARDAIEKWNNASYREWRPFITEYWDK